MNNSDLEGASVELTAPDGRILHFVCGGTFPYAGESYVVLRETEGDSDAGEQILITRAYETDDTVAFEAVEEDDIVEAVYEKYLMASLLRQTQGLEDAE